MGRNKKHWIPEYHLIRIKNVVHHAIHRCTDTNDTGYKNYGGRGIKVWKEWIKFPEWFAAYICTLPGWDKVGLSIDRIDNDKGYVPGNLQWATAKQQAQNTQRYTGLGRGTETDCDYCRKHFTRRREYQKFCSRRCASEIGWRRRWNYG